MWPPIEVGHEHKVNTTASLWHNHTVCENEEHKLCTFSIASYYLSSVLSLRSIPQLTSIDAVCCMYCTLFWGSYFRCLFRCLRRKALALRIFVPFCAVLCISQSFHCVRERGTRIVSCAPFAYNGRGTQLRGFHSGIDILCYIHWIIFWGVVCPTSSTEGSLKVCYCVRQRGARTVYVSIISYCTGGTSAPWFLCTQYGTCLRVSIYVVCIALCWVSFFPYFSRSPERKEGSVKTHFFISDNVSILFPFVLKRTERTSLGGTTSKWIAFWFSVACTSLHEQMKKMWEAKLVTHGTDN